MLSGRNDGSPVSPKAWGGWKKKRKGTVQVGRVAFVSDLAFEILTLKIKEEGRFLEMR